MATKTIALTGAEVAVLGLDGAHAHIRNDGTDTIYASKKAGAGKAIFILEKNKEMLYNINFITIFILLSKNILK